MNRKRTPKQETMPGRDTAGRIVTEATRLFAENGYDGVSIKKISVAAGVNIAAINYHFESKGNLFRHIIEQFLSELFVSSRKTLLPPRSREDLKVRLEVFVRQTMDAIMRQPDVITIIHREMERSNEVFQQTIMKHREALIGFLQHAKRKGFVAADVDPLFAAEFLMGQIAHSRRRDSRGKDLYGRSPASEKFRDKWIRQTLRLFLDGVIGT
jgi:AcrR family transcriptional regulator